MSEEKVMPGEKERKEIEARFREIHNCAKVKHPLPEKYVNNTEIKAYVNLIELYARYRQKEIDKELFRETARQIKIAHYKEYRDFLYYAESVKQQQRRALLLSQLVAKTIKEFGNMTSFERIDNLLKILGFVFTPVEEKVLRERLAKSKDKPKKTSKAKETKAKKTGFDFEKVAKEYFKDEHILSLISQWYENRRAKKNIVNTENAIRQNLKRVTDFADKSGLTIEKYLEEVIRLGWAAFYPVDSNEAKPKAANKQSVFGSDASYNLEAFDKNIVGMRYLDEESGETK